MTAPTLRERIRTVTDAVRKGDGPSVAEIARLIGEPVTTVSPAVTKMARRGELSARGTHQSRTYRSGPNPVVSPGSGGHNRKCGRGGFMRLRRLEREDPAERARLTRNDPTNWWPKRAAVRREDVAA